MAGNSSDARQQTHSRLTKRVDRFRPRDETSKVFKDIAAYLLETNPHDGTHNRQSIQMDIRALLPAAETVFTRANFHNGGYAAVLIYQVAQFYEAFDITSEVESRLPSPDRVNPSILAYAWLSSVYGQIENVSRLAQAFHEARSVQPYYVGPAGSRPISVSPPGFKVSPSTGFNRQLSQLNVNITNFRSIMIILLVTIIITK